MSASEAAVTIASTKRNPAPSSGIIGDPVTNLATVAIVPLLPASPELVEELELKNPREAKWTCAFANSSNVLPDIIEGDILVVGAVEYLIKMVREWQRPLDGSYLEIVALQRKVAA